MDDGGLQCSAVGRVLPHHWKPAWMTPFIHEPIDPEDVDQKTKRRPPYLAICLVLLTTAGFSVQLVAALRLFSAPVIASTALWALAVISVGIRRPRTASILLVFALTGIVALQVSFLALHETRWSWNPTNILIISSVATALLAMLITLNMPIREPSWPREGISRPFTHPTNQLRSPEDNLTLWQWMSISWMSPLISTGSKRQLHDEDVWLLGYEFQHRHLHDAFRELKGTVIKRLLRANWIDLGLLTALAILELAANYSAPVLLQQLLRAMEQARVTKRPAITYAVLMLVVRLVAAQSAVFSLWFGRRCYERSRGEMITMLYEKTLNRKIVGAVQDDEKDDEVGAGEDQEAAEHLLGNEEDEGFSEDEPLLNGHSKGASGGKSRIVHYLENVWRWLPWSHKKEVSEKEHKQPASMGKILNLMRNDVYEVAQRFWEFQTLVNKPLGLIVSLVLVWRLIGWPCLLGVAVVLVAQVLNALLARILIGWERVRRQATDGKLQQISQYVEAIRHLRWYGWTYSWLDKIMEAREKELNLKVITYLWNIAIIFTNTLANGALPVVAFYAYTALAGQELRVDVAFPALQLFSMLQSNLKEIPGLITVLLNASVAVGRIEDFMSEPDKAENDDVVPRHTEELAVENASFAWPATARNVLHNVSLSFPIGLTVIHGPVASGKTALLQALLGELDLRGGLLSRPKTPVGYCSQSPWLQSMSIRENILFSSPYEDARYKQTLDACALTADLASFKHGDLSSIGENGIGLSGGQKARVALARAVYSRANILLLDDPLSALDQQTAEWIVAKCLRGKLLQGRTVILVTHRTDLCGDLAIQLVEISHGIVSAQNNEAAPAESEDVSISDSTNNGRADGLTDPSQEEAAVPDKFVEEEHRARGGVQLAVYWEYVKAGKAWWLLVICAAVLVRLFMVAETWFLKSWGEAYGEAQERMVTLQTPDTEVHLFANPIKGFFDRFPDPAINVQPWLVGFLVLVVAQAMATLAAQCLMLVVTYTAGRKMFRDIMKRVSNATFRFYDVTPVGRLMNRLTSDMGTVDGNISNQFLNVAWQAIAWISSIVVIASITPLFLVFSLALTLAFVFVFLRFLPTSQSLRRLEMVSLSPLMSNFGALLEGLMTVRAFCAQPQFQARVISVTDAFQKMDHFYWSLQSWLMYRFDTLSAASTFLLTLLAIYSGLSPGLTAFVLIAASKFVQSTHALCRQYGQLQLDFVSVERVVELIRLEQEPSGTVAPPAWWPSHDSDVVFEDVTIRYAPHLPPALSGVSFHLSAGSNTAVIGRTGSGKSTLALTLLATLTPESGRILIGGIDIAKVDKQALRSRITFLAQDPVLFPGSLRHNLDPTEEHSDAACAAVVDRVGGSKYGWTLDTRIDSGGRNLSQGQRQLVGLARAILRRSAIVVMDEATASIDKTTAWEIQRVVREEMKDSTVITIAHRPSAVRGADFCIALAKGEICAQGSPEDVVGILNGGVEEEGEDAI